MQRREVYPNAVVDETIPGGRLTQPRRTEHALDAVGSRVIVKHQRGAVFSSEQPKDWTAMVEADVPVEKLSREEALASAHS